MTSWMNMESFTKSSTSKSGFARFLVVVYSSLYGPLLHSPLLFAANPRRCVFDPSEDSEAVGEGRGDKRVSTGRVGVKNDNET
jgi:hypothetical protein